MNRVFLAAVDPETEKVLESWRIATPATRERLMILAATGLITVLLLLWAVLRRRKRRHRHSHHHSQHHSSRSGEVASGAKGDLAPARSGRRRRRRRSGRHHRPRNPTLAETGGLPPVRSESPPEAQP